ncbi:hypothetical protein [Shewanella sp. MEBiC00475]|uniref:hypothetical protein n=1 Tax=Shewanella sp. MEBiC00475 TaxID=2575361 RepID=UPI0010C0F085|nr:hypothetical protein [Shewanella sp. MEBiC00475]
MITNINFLNETHPKKTYAHIDFILCLDNDVEVNETAHMKEDITYSKGFFLKKEHDEYELFHSAPFSKMLFQELMRADELNV